MGHTGIGVIYAPAKWNTSASIYPRAWRRRVSLWTHNGQTFKLRSGCCTTKRGHSKNWRVANGWTCKIGRTPKTWGLPIVLCLRRDPEPHKTEKIILCQNRHRPSHKTKASEQPRGKTKRLRAGDCAVSAPSGLSRASPILGPNFGHVTASVTLPGRRPGRQRPRTKPEQVELTIMATASGVVAVHERWGNDRKHGDRAPARRTPSNLG